jgi:hypothetical protein
MRIANRSVIKHWLTLGNESINEGCVCVSLKDGLLKIFNDGENALIRENKVDELGVLHQCRDCVCNSVTTDASCIDMDAFMKELHPRDNRPKSVDMVLPIVNDVDSNSFDALCVEGKLGLICKKNPRTPTRISLIDKFKETKAALTSLGINVLNNYYILVTKATYEQEKRRAYMWNKESKLCTFYVKACARFLNEVGIQQAPSTCPCDV